MYNILNIMMNDIFKPTHLKELCTKYNLTPSKKYGQNYLISKAPIEKMLDAAGIKKGDKVIEIGPGFGVLTFGLLERGADVTAFEIERKLEPYWNDIQEKYDNFEVIWGNAIDTLQDTRYTLHDYKVVANLPYQITSHVLRTILELENKPESITVMVQKEVADRIVAKPSRKASPRDKGDMSLLSVSIQYYGEPKVVTKVPAGNFWPAPKVDSAVVHIAIKQSSTSAHFDNQFFEVVRAGFANKRKQVWSNLSKGLKLDGDRVKSVLIEVTGNEKVRAQEIGVEEWKEVTRLLYS